MKTLKPLLCLGLFCLPLWAKAQEATDPLPAISSDRPSQGTNSPNTLPKGYFQLESGISFSHSLLHPNRIPWQNQMGDPLLEESEDIRLDIYHLPEFLFKYGLSDRLEIRAGSILLHSDQEETENSFPVSPDTYLQDLRVGLKYKVLHYHKSRGNLSLIAEAVVPGTRTGKHLLNSNLGVNLYALNSYLLADWLELTGNIGYSYGGKPGFTGTKETSWAILSSYFLSQKLTFFSEWYGRNSLSTDEKVFHALDGGFLYLINKNVQLDISAGLGLTEDIYEYQYHLSSGISWRTKFF